MRLANGFFAVGKKGFRSRHADRSPSVNERATIGKRHVPFEHRRVKRFSARTRGHPLRVLARRRKYARYGISWQAPRALTPFEPSAAHRAQAYSCSQSCQNATALAAATLRESTPYDIGIFTE